MLVQVLLKKEQNYENKRQKGYDKCIETAEKNYDLLWDANCPKNKPSCSLEDRLSKWVEGRYDKEIQVCIKRYK